MPEATSQVSSAESSATKPPAGPRGFTRRQFFRRALAYASIPGALALYSTQVEPFWTEIHEISLPVRNLPESFHNHRIAHLTDLHTGRTDTAYLKKVISKVLALKPDIVVVTGDLTHHTSRFIPTVVRMLARFPVPVIVSYGNHDYGVYRDNDETADDTLPQVLADQLTRAGYHVLRNQSMSLDHSDGRLWFVGLDDLWFGNFDAPTAFANVPHNEPVIALSHNPDTAARVDAHAPSLILAGHTHGGQVRLPGIGALYLNTADTALDQGLFQLKNSPLYVSRGVGYIQRIRFYCRPEVPIFKLVQA